MADVDRLYAQFLSELRARLKPLGFRRSGTTFFRAPTPPATNWMMVNVQTLKVPAGREFVINYGIISPLLLRTADSGMAPPPTEGKLPKPVAQLSSRLEAGWDERPGYNWERWWRISPDDGDDELDRLEDEVVERLPTEALPRLEPLLTDGACATTTCTSWSSRRARWRRLTLAG